MRRRNVKRPSPPFTPAAELPDEQLKWAIEKGADVAWESGEVVAVLGIRRGLLKVCNAGCCLRKPGAIIVIPDVKAVELTRDSGRALPYTCSIECDNRVAYIFRSNPR